MRALLVCAAPVPGTTELVARLAADAELIVAVDGGGAVCLAAGVTPNLLVGDFDSLGGTELGRLSAEGVEILRFPVEKDVSDLEIALRIAGERGATQVTLTAAFADRLDHTLVALGVVAAAARLEPSLVEPGMRGWCMSAAGRCALSLQGCDETVSLVAFDGEAVVSATGMVWPLEEARLAPTSSLGLSNRIASGAPAHFAVSRGTVWVLAPVMPGGVGAREV